MDYLRKGPDADYSPGFGHVAVTPSDSTDLTTPCRSLWIGGAGSGNLRITNLQGQVVNFAGVPAGDFRHGARRVHATGTDVTSILAVY